MKNFNLDFNIYTFQINILSDVQAPLNKLELDFYYFKHYCNFKTSKILEIEIISGESFSLPEGLIAQKQTQNSITYTQGNITYNDYYGKAVVEFDYKNEKAKIYYYDQFFIHELVYLIILSRSGKYLDKKGIHKIHAAAFGIGEKDIILTLPSKGGKTSTLLELLRDPNIRLISDDTPLVDPNGRILAFPLRIGLGDKNKIFSYFPYLRDTDLYEFKRVYFGKKYLIPVNKLKNEISIGKTQILINGKRTTLNNSYLEKISKIRMFIFLIEHMIIGIGLPMIVEYFLRSTVKDYFLNLKILIHRVVSAYKLVRKSDCYIFYMSRNAVESGSYLRDFFK